MNDERRLHSAARPQPQPDKSEVTSGSDGFALAQLDRLLDVRERIVYAIDQLEAGEPGINPCRVALEALLEDFDREVAAERSR